MLVFSCYILHSYYTDNYKYAMVNKKKSEVTYEDIIQWLEEAYFEEDDLDYDNPYKPLNFHDDEKDED